MKKNLKGTTIALLLLLSFSCEKDDSELSTESTIEQERITESKSFIQTSCGIIGSTVVATPEGDPSIAIVSAGSTVVYSYTNNTGTSGSINWAFTSLVPSGSATLSQSGSNVTVIFNSNFTSAILQAAGTGGTAQVCNAILNISEGTIIPTCTTVSSNVTATGPSYMSGATYSVSWSYDGVADADVTFRWWYQKTIANGGLLEEPKVIGYGRNTTFVALPSSYYSDNHHKTSDFKIYLEVTDGCENRYYSHNYHIMKKGKYELGGF